MQLRGLAISREDYQLEPPVRRCCHLFMLQQAVMQGRQLCPFLGLLWLASWWRQVAIRPSNT